MSGRAEFETWKASQRRDHPASVALVNALATELGGMSEFLREEILQICNEGFEDGEIEELELCPHCRTYVEPSALRAAEQRNGGTSD